MNVNVSIRRYDPDSGRDPVSRHYTVAAQPHERILDCLNRIRWEQDGSLAYRMSCGHGVCGSDAMLINGRCALACQKLVREYDGAAIEIAPLPHFRVIKDLIVDLEPFFERVAQVRPYLISPDDAPEKERPQAPAERHKIDEVIRCILCACCTGACPNMSTGADFLGPAPLVWAFRFVFDSRDGQRAQRLNEADRPEGAWGCDNHFECTRVCPKEIPVTKSINFIKQAIEKHLR